MISTGTVTDFILLCLIFLGYLRLRSLEKREQKKEILEVFERLGTNLRGSEIADNSTLSKRGTIYVTLQEMVKEGTLLMRSDDVGIIYTVNRPFKLYTKE